MRRDAYDLRLFAQCRTCFEPMCGILSIKAREDCAGCGGVALNVNNQRPSEPKEFIDKAKKVKKRLITKRRK